MSWLEVENVSLAFGGLKAVDNLSFSVEPGKVFTIIGPNSAGKSTVFNLISRIYDPINGDIRFGGESLLGAKPHEVINHGIARTFQNIELFEHASLLDNLPRSRLSGSSRKRTCGTRNDDPPAVLL